MHIRITLRTSLLVLLGQRRRAFWLAFAYWRRLYRADVHPVVCSWCQRTQTFGNPALPTSHGICHACRIAHFRDMPLAPLVEADAA